MTDPLLTRLVAAGVTMPITLIVGGTVAEGEMVAESDWLDQLASALEAGGPGAAMLGDRLRTVKVHVEMAAETGTHSELVHLRDARVTAGGQVVAVGLWRVRLDAVDGWKLGSALPQRLRAVEG